MLVKSWVYNSAITDMEQPIHRWRDPHSWVFTWVCVCVGSRACGAAWNSSIVFYQSYAAVIIILGRDVEEKRMTERCWLKQLRPLKPALKCSLNQTGARAASFLHYLKSVLMQRVSQKLSCSNQCLQWYCVIQTLQINRKRGKPPFSFPLPEHV